MTEVSETNDQEPRRTVVSLRAHRERCDGHDDELIGSFWLDAPRAHQHLETTDCGCPYCGGPLRQLVVASGVAIWRVIGLEDVAVDDQQIVIIDLLPAGYRVLSCGLCRQA